MIDHWYVTSLVAAHFAGDWWWQSREMAMNKSSDLKVLIRHLVRITGILAIPVLLHNPGNIYPLISNAVFHGYIDWHIWQGYKHDILTKVNFDDTKFKAYEYWKDKRFYDVIACDQFLHLAIIMLLFT